MVVYAQGRSHTEMLSQGNTWQTNGPQFRDVGPAVRLPDRMRTLGHLIGILEESLRQLGVLGIVYLLMYI